MESKEMWFEVYEFVDNDIINGTQTLACFDTLQEAQMYCIGNPNYYIDKWVMIGNNVPSIVY